MVPGFSEAITDPKAEEAVEQAFQAWAKASGLKFEEVAAGTTADINVDFSDLQPGSTNEIGLTQYKSQGGALSAGVQVELEDPSETALTTNASGQLSYTNTDATFEQVALHEIGHALGLADNDIAGSIMNGVLGTGNQTLSAKDVTNIQSLYGATIASSNSPHASQVHQLVQAMSTFDVAQVGVDSALLDDGMPMYQELRAVAGLHTSAYVV